MLSTARVLVLVAQITFEAKNWPLLNEYINTLSKRRGQLKQAVAKLVQEVCTYLDKVPTKELKYELIATLRDVTEGKIYVEVERARLTKELAKMKEEEGNIIEAANILQDLQVETYGSMEKREKVRKRPSINIIYYGLHKVNCHLKPMFHG
jgi:26S proteasome regulatory subunit N5